jgi:hypothetical protein
MSQPIRSFFTKPPVPDFPNYVPSPERRAEEVLVPASVYKAKPADIKKLKSAYGHKPTTEEVAQFEESRKQRYIDQWLSEQRLLPPTSDIEAPKKKRSAKTSGRVSSAESGTESEGQREALENIRLISDILAREERKDEEARKARKGRPKLSKEQKQANKEERDKKKRAERRAEAEALGEPIEPTPVKRPRGRPKKAEPPPRVTLKKLFKTETPIPKDLSVTLADFPIYKEEKRPRGRPRKAQLINQVISKQVIKQTAQLLGEIKRQYLMDNSKYPSTKGYKIITKLVEYPRIRSQKKALFEVAQELIRPDTFEKTVVVKNLSDVLQVFRFILKNNYAKEQDIIDRLKRLMYQYSTTEKQLNMMEKFLKSIGASPKLSGGKMDEWLKVHQLK